jgi:hypothetical protein
MKLRLNRRAILWLTVANGAFLFGNLILFVAKPNYIVRVLGAMPASLATLTVGVIGVLGVGWQTNRGFRNLIRSQEHRARIEKQAREDQATLDEKARAHERQFETRVIAASIHAELIGLKPRIEYLLTNYKTRLALLKVAKEDSARGRATNNRLYTLSIVKIRTPVFDQYAEKLGQLGISIAADVILVYSDIQHSEGHPDINLTLDFAIGAYTAIVQRFEAWPAEIELVAKRLGAVQGLWPDPGNLMDFRAQRLKEASSAQR